MGLEGNNKRAILIIDNSTGRVNNLGSILPGEYKIIKVPDGRAALSVIEREKGDFQIVLMNMELNDIPGLKLIRKIIDAAPLLEIIVYTEKDNTDDAVSAMEEGAFYYLYEPLQEQEVNALIELAINEANRLKKIKSYCEKKAILSSRSFSKRLSIIRHLMAKMSIEGRMLKSHEMHYILHPGKGDVSYEDFISKLYKTPLTPREEERPTVLIVDDDRTFRKGTRLALKDYYKVLAAENGTMALKIAEENRDIDVILLDIVMPDYSGIDLLPMLQERVHKAEIVIITAHNITGIAVNALHLGACIFLTKPFLEGILLKSVATALRTKVLKKYLNELGEIISYDQPGFSFNLKLNMLVDFYKSSVRKGVPVTLGQVYAIFPTFAKCGHPEEKELPMDIDPKYLLDWLAYNLSPKELTIH
ncbi:MAG TPA: response regulator [Nitrospirae bacterium]|nr:response regulator [Nitrospirota bacterium]